MTYLSPFIFLLALLLSACSSNPISYGNDYREGVDFTLYKSYSWHEPNERNKSSDDYIADPRVDKEIREKIDQILAAKGYKKVDSGPVDFFVNYSIATTDRMAVNNYNNYNGVQSGMAYGVGGYRHYGTHVETTVEYYSEGTFVLDIVGAKEGKLEWRGSAEAQMPRSMLTPEKRSQVIDEVVKNVLNAFPPE